MPPSRDQTFTPASAARDHSRRFRPGIALSGLPFLPGAPIAPALSPIHRHGPQDDNDDRHKAADSKPIDDVAREKAHSRILARWGPRDPKGRLASRGPLARS